MRTKSIMPIILAVAIATLLVTPAFAARPEIPGQGKGKPKYTCYMSYLYNDATGGICGKAIFNTNPEEEYEEKYQLEVEIEECSELAAPEEGQYNSVNVYLDEEFIGTIDVDYLGNGKAEFHVDEILTTSVVKVIYDETVLISGSWNWFKGPVP